MAVRSGPKKLDAEALWNYALAALGARAHSTAELRRKLVRRAELPSDVNATLSRLREYGMVDDAKFSETFASSRLANRGHGKMRVLRDLRAKQVSAGVAERAVNTSFEGTDEQQLAQSYLDRKYRGKDMRAYLAEDKNFASAFRRLRVAGFSAGAAIAALKRYHARADEYEPGEEDTEVPPEG